MAELSGQDAPCRVEVVQAAPPVVRITGEVDLAAVPAFRAAIDKLVQGPAPEALVCDMAGVTFIDSSGVGLFLALVQEGVPVIVRHPSVAVRRIIEVTGLTGILPVEP